MHKKEVGGKVEGTYLHTRGKGQSYHISYSCYKLIQQNHHGKWKINWFSAKCFIHVNYKCHLFWQVENAFRFHYSIHFVLLCQWRHSRINIYLSRLGKAWKYYFSKEILNCLPLQITNVTTCDQADRERSQNTFLQVKKIFGDFCPNKFFF